MNYWRIFPSLQTASRMPCCRPESRGSAMPSCLQVKEMKVFAKRYLQQGVVFGPFVGEISRQVPSNLEYVWAVSRATASEFLCCSFCWLVVKTVDICVIFQIRDDSAFIYVNSSDENKSNWMRSDSLLLSKCPCCGCWCRMFSLCFRFVTYTSCEEDHNLVIFQFYRRIYYKVSQPISEGAELKVQISRDYAALLGLSMGQFTHRSQPCCHVLGKSSQLPPFLLILLVGGV